METVDTFNLSERSADKFIFGFGKASAKNAMQKKCQQNI